MGRTWMLAVAVASLEALSSVASAGTISINPTRIVLTTRTRSTLLTLRNDGGEQVRFQVSAFDWDQDPDGQMALRPSDDIVCFPSVLTVEAGQVRNIRIGTSGEFGDRERNYRIFVEEIPPARSQAAGIQVLTRLGVPVFLRPEAPREEASLENLVLERDGLSFDLRNTGTVHFIPDVVSVNGTGAAGETIVAEKLESWYVLAGGMRRFRVTFDPATCSRLTRIAVEAHVGEATLTRSLETSTAACRDVP
jgi:fimbrial chaperone protein